MVGNSPKRCIRMYLLCCTNSFMTMLIEDSVIDIPDSICNSFLKIDTSFVNNIVDSLAETYRSLVMIVSRTHIAAS
jgi:hypothetical protein